VAGVAAFDRKPDCSICQKCSDLPPRRYKAEIFSL